MFPASVFVRAAPALFILIWSSGYVVAKVAAPHADPLTFLLLRFLGVAALMTALALAAGARWPGRRDVLHLAVAGIAMQAGYLGGVWVAIAQGMPAGVAALIVNLQPVLTAILAPLVGERLSSRQWAGVLLGFAGVVAVVWQKVVQSSGLLVLPTAICVFALLSMTAGTLYQKRFVPRADLRTGQLIQSAAAIAVTLPIALATEAMRFDVGFASLAALLWSVIVLTGGGTSLIFLLLREGKATTFTSYLYLVPAVTAVMAWLMFGETLTGLALAGMALSLFGVWLVAANGAGGKR
ncbi:MAG: DMT family transporter [Burkholderiaceae bacterium]|jgi:drug/metabolite transporter (DMT)-like permease